MVRVSNNGKSLKYFDETAKVLRESPTGKCELSISVNSVFIFIDFVDLYQEHRDDGGSLQATSEYNQLKVLLRRGYIKTKRDQVTILLLSIVFLSKLRTDILDVNLYETSCKCLCRPHVGHFILESGYRWIQSFRQL